jgi:pimeloyl-ACP methyl ester carboxylesterase
MVVSLVANTPSSSGADKTTQHIDISGGTIAYDDTGGDGPLVVMLPGAGDVRSEYRFVTPLLVDGGARVVSMDLRGHGDSSAAWPGYGVADTASDLVALLDHLAAGPATVVATSFAPAAALWAAADRPDLIHGLVLISAHLETPSLLGRIALSLMMRGPFAGRLWAGQFRKWHPAAPPADLAAHADGLAAMIDDAPRRRAVRETLLAARDGLESRVAGVRVPTLVVMGGADAHFKDPAAEGDAIASQTGGRAWIVPDAGHYPHVEFPDQVATAITSFLAEHPS